MSTGAAGTAGATAGATASTVAPKPAIPATDYGLVNAFTAGSGAPCAGGIPVVQAQHQIDRPRGEVARLTAGTDTSVPLVPGTPTAASAAANLVAASSSNALK